MEVHQQQAAPHVEASGGTLSRASKGSVNPVDDEDPIFETSRKHPYNK